jgi:hypothetical protein
MVAVVACAGAALTSWMGGSRALPVTFLSLAVAFALVLAARQAPARRPPPATGTSPAARANRPSSW